MFQVSLTNFGTYFSVKFLSFQAAVDFAKSEGFEATIHDLVKGVIVGTYSPLNGASKW